MALILVLILVFQGKICNGIDSDVYFYLKEHSSRCFYEELPARTILIGDYKHPEVLQGKPAIVMVKDPSGERVYSEQAEEKGRFAYHAVSAGEHLICVESEKTSNWPEREKTAKFHLKIEIHGKDSEIDQDTAKKEHLTSLEKELEELDNKVDLVLKDLEYSKTQEQHFRDQTERINSRIMWWSLFQSFVLLLVGAWQVNSLQSFFRAKKLV